MEPHYLKKELYGLVKSDEHIFDFIQEGSLDGLWYWDLEKPENEWMSKRFWRTLGYDPEKMPHLVSAWQDIINQDDLKVALDNFNKHIENPEHPYDQIVRYRHMNGSTVWIRCRGLAVRDKSGKPVRMLGAHQDITELKEAEKQIIEEKNNARASNKKYKAIYDNAPLAFQSLDENGFIMDVNPYWLKTLGYKKEQVLGKWFGDFLCPGSKEAFQKNFSVFKREGFISDVEYCMIKKDKSEIIVTFEGCIGYNHDGKFKQTYCTFKDITKEKKAVHALKESESKYRQLVETASDAIYLMDDTATIIDTNQFATQLLGRSKDEIIGSKINMVDPNYSVEEFLDFWKSIPYEQQKIFETTHKTKNGELIPIEISGKKFKISNKTYYCGIARDINQRIATEKSLRVSKERFQLAMDASNDGLWDWNLVTNEVYFSPGWKRLLGYKEEELENVFSIWEELTHPDDVKRTWDIFHACKDGKQDKFESEIKMKHKDGSWVNILSRAEMHYDSKGKAVRLIGTHVDITERVKAREELIVRETLFNNVLNTIPDMVSIHDSDLNIVYSNWKGFAAVPEDKRIPFTKCYKTYRSYDQVCPDCHAKIVLETMEPYNSEVELPDGKWVELRVLPILNYNKGKKMFVEWVRDITSIKQSEFILKEKNVEYEAINEELRQVNEELCDAKEKAEESDRLKTEFLNNMSHEIRTPMNGILGFTQMIEKTGLSHEKRKYYSRLIQNSSQQLLKIIDDILEISRLETKQVQITKHAFCLNDLLMDIFSIFNLRSTERKLPIYLKKGLSDKESTIISDKSKLHKIISNLVDNALKYTNKGFVEMGYQRQTNHLVLYVKDTGDGIAPVNQHIIFERFSQIDKNVSRKFGGLGIGLSIVKENAEIIGGEISLESETGKGSTFYVSIPYEPLQQVHGSEITTTGESGLAQQDVPLTILIAEDEEVNLLYIEALLEDEMKFPYQIIHAKNGKEAVEHVKEKNNIDIVLMDIKMPVLNGHDAAKAIKSIWPGLPIIAQTAYSTESDKNMAFANGCDEFISKPIDGHKLIHLISKHALLK